MLLGIALFLPVSTSSAPLQLISTRDPAQNPPAGGSGDSWGPILSPKGRYVLFASTANNLVTNSNGNPLPIRGAPRLNVFLRDRITHSTILVSPNFGGTAGGNGDSIPTGLSTHGRYALFESRASDLVPNDTNGVTDIFLRDVWSNTTRLVSISMSGGAANGVSRSSVMTPDGRYVAFVSAATNLVPDDTNGIPDIFVRDLQTATTTLVSVGAQNTNSARGSLASSESPAITPDGRFVVFYSTATNLIPGAGGVGEIFVRDLRTATTIWASSNTRALLGYSNAVSYNQTISSDGRYVTYQASTNSGALPIPNAQGSIIRFNVNSGRSDLISTNANVQNGPNSH
jgi:Tol biopolymer transport system component